MEALFIKILDMSITACWMIFAAIILRLVLKNAPKNIRFLLWALVGIRLVCPISLESIFSMVPTSEPISNNFFSVLPQATTQINTAVNTVIPTIPSVPQVVEPKISIISVLAVIWLIGVAGMAIYTIFSYFNIHRKVKASLKKENNVYICDDIESPFLLGFFRPKIYIPSDLSAEEEVCVLEHERSHIKRLDHIWKPLGFAILSVYWFNPIIWVAYILLCRDIELACDEKVIKKMDIDEKRRYSQALLNCSISRRTVAACPLAFGEVGVKSRIRSILNYKKPVFWVILISVIICIIAGILFLTDQPREKSLDFPTEENYRISLVCKDPGSRTSVLKPYIELYTTNNTFYFMFSGFSSYLPYGTYRITGEQLILETEDGQNTYVFDIVGKNQLTFNEKESSELPSYRIQGGSSEFEKPIKDGVLFILDSIWEIPSKIVSKDETYSGYSEKIPDYKLKDEGTKYHIYSKQYPTTPASKIELLLYEEYNDFVLYYPILSSIGVWGTYEKTGNKLICTSNDGNYKYVFDITDEGYVFRDEVPFKHPQYDENSNMETLVDGDLLTEPTSAPKNSISVISSIVKAYYCYDNDGNINDLKPILNLYSDEKRFRLVYNVNAVISYNGISGTYQESENKLTCTAYGGEYKYIFDITENGYIFNSEIPFDHPLCNGNTECQPLVDGDILSTITFDDEYLFTYTKTHS